MANRESVIYVVMFIIGVVFLIESLRLGLGRMHQPGIGFFPFFTGVALSVIALYSLVKNFLVAKREKGKDIEKFFGPSAFNVGKIIACLYVYVFITPWLGFILSTFILFIILYKVGGIRKWTATLLYSFLTISLTYFIFSYWLNLRFPKGFLGF